jgi:hypothetical protein
MKSIIKPWVAELGLRHQGVLVSAVRGPDGVDRNDPIKTLVRMLRGEILESHNGDVTKASSYMIDHNPELFELTAERVIKSCDHYNLHFFMHFVHAVEIMGYYSPDWSEHWHGLYLLLCRKLHLNHETMEQLDRRLNADEKTFARQQEAIG